MRKWIACFLLLTLSCGLAACGTKAPEPAGMVQTTAPEETSFSIQETVGEQTLLVKAEARPETLGECIYLTYDEAAAEQLFRKVVGSEENLRKENETEQGKGMIWSTDSAEPGSVYYQGLARDRNGSSLEDGPICESNDSTQQIPAGMGKTGQETAEETAAFLHEYSCLAFAPWNVQAMEDDQGYYYMNLRCLFEGKKILGDIPIVTAAVSPEGLFSFDGPILLKEERREEIGEPLTLAAAVEKLKTDFAGYSLAKTVTIDRISLQYYAEKTAEGWILHPAWVFSGKESAQLLDYAPASPNPKEEPISFCYFLDDGFLEIIQIPIRDIF